MGNADKALCFLAESKQSQILAEFIRNTKCKHLNKRLKQEKGQFKVRLPVIIHLTVMQVYAVFQGRNTSRLAQKLLLKQMFSI